MRLPSAAELMRSNAMENQDADLHVLRADLVRRRRDIALKLRGHEVEDLQQLTVIHTAIVALDAVLCQPSQEPPSEGPDVSALIAKS
jgi:hypothetical protein